MEWTFVNLCKEIVDVLVTYDSYLLNDLYLIVGVVNQTWNC